MCTASIRIGLACFIFSFALLTGNPISGALLHAPDYFWSRAIVFNAVRRGAACSGHGQGSLVVYAGDGSFRVLLANGHASAGGEGQGHAVGVIVQALDPQPLGLLAVLCLFLHYAISFVARPACYRQLHAVYH